MAVAPPRPKGPPLNALRAFETAARLGSFSLAGDELCVTAGAIAQQIKSLEAWIGCELFERKAQGVQLSSVGKTVIPEFTKAFDQLGYAVQTLRNNALPSDVRIAALPAIAQLWLSPRLPGIRERIPEISISITALENAPNLMREPYDATVFFCEDEDLEGRVTLGPDRIYPVCAPQLKSRLRKPSDLLEIPCLFDAIWERDWEIWLTEAYQLSLIGRLRGPVFSLYSLAVQEAISGAGVLMGHHDLVKPYLDQGKLVKIFENKSFTGRSLCIERSMSGLSNPYLQKALGILLEQP
ncbi:MAG: LysR family transcriptional regulator [Sneathiellales bacterium]|nr:LysR family transcriptional regulator [Sneathiellales bacterium]